MLRQSDILPLVLSAKRKEFRYTDPHSDEADAEFSAVRSRVRDRDDHTCRACGFHMKQAGIYMQVHHLNDDHADNSMKNLVTLCMHCHAPFHVGFWGRREGSVLAFVPEIEQWQLSHLFRLQMIVKHSRDMAERDLHVASQARGGVFKQAGAGNDEQKKLTAIRKIEDALDALMARIRAREEEARRLFGTSSPVELAEALTKLPDAAYRNRSRSLLGLRLVTPARITEMGTDVMSPIVQKWIDKGGPFVQLPPQAWSKLLG